MKGPRPGPAVLIFERGWTREMSDWLRQIRKIVLLFLAVIAFGVAGFMAVEGWGFLDALFMTVVTISTVGYREVQPLTSSGMVFALVAYLPRGWDLPLRHYQHR